VLEKCLVQAAIARGEKPSRVAKAFDDLLPLTLTHAELEQLRLDVFFEQFRRSDPDEQRELLRKMNACPICKRSMLMGHNGPPADGRETPYRRQAQFDF
jgi:hypothetical protein